MIKKDSTAKSIFKVEWKGAQLGFTEVTGLDIQVENLKDSGNSLLAKHDIHNLIRKSSNTITFKRGWMELDSKNSNSWNHYFNKDNVKHDLSISLFNEKNIPVMVWKLHKARLIKAEASAKKTGNEVAIEVLEFEWEAETLPNIKI